jgi:3-oxoacyl-[acyl-carrier protein] reductase/2-hydroxycyclohexanecarboxyl-CoA dehydrogenase
MRFADQVVVVVGGGSGIGRAAVQEFAREGARVVVADKNAAGARETQLSCPENVVTARECDATDFAACQSLVAETAAQLGRLDVLVTTVGWTDVTPFLSESPDYWDCIVGLNLMSCIYLTYAASQHMTANGGGAIVLTSSDAGKTGQSREAVYSAAKAGVIGLVKATARELARYHVRVNAVAPGPTRTPLIAGQDEEMTEKILRASPLRRLAEAHEVADAIVFLASARSSHIIGQTISVSGGLSMSS